jgi:hypothetical protein
VEGQAIWQTFVEAPKRHQPTKRISPVQPRTTSSRNRSHVSSVEEAIVFQNAGSATTMRRSNSTMNGSALAILKVATLAPKLTKRKHRNHLHLCLREQRAQLLSKQIVLDY